ncbi:unnamed protein product [Periconia digitata]|uniref:Uncharacterized protein n=1 Tax=Periconia digitata TaxID=1303443 RepID=A0A9W4URA6_9PLEO|nr:unnamed protein product [Periconia digitata]
MACMWIDPYVQFGCSISMLLAILDRDPFPLTPWSCRRSSTSCLVPIQILQKRHCGSWGSHHLPYNLTWQFVGSASAFLAFASERIVMRNIVMVLRASVPHSAWPKTVVMGFEFPMSLASSMPMWNH